MTDPGSNTFDAGSEAAYHQSLMPYWVQRTHLLVISIVEMVRNKDSIDIISIGFAEAIVIIMKRMVRVEVAPERN